MSNSNLDKYDTARLLDERIATLCQTLADKHTAKSPGLPLPTTYALDDHRAGTRFVRIVMTYGSSSRSVHAFVDTTTGALIKAAGWKVPAKRRGGLASVGSLLDDIDFVRIINECDPYGSYLYAR